MPQMSDESGDSAGNPRLRDFYIERPILNPAETEEGKARAREYRLALGTFIDTFAKVEQAMFFVLTWRTKTKTQVARAVFSGARTDTASGFLRRLADVGSIDTAEWDKLEPVLNQLRIINDLRNTLLHNTTTGVESGRGFVTDAIRALNQDRMRVFPISPAILDTMTHDCRKIFLHLIVQHAGRPVVLLGKHPELDEILRAAWRYIPPQQAPIRPKESKSRSRRRLDSDQQPPRPPLASPE
jgi:hypothetical protein